MPPAKPKPLKFDAALTGDSPEIAAYKASLIESAKEAVQGRNLQEVLNVSPILRRVFSENGITLERKVKVKVTTTHPFEFVVNVAPSALAGKTVEEQHEVLAAEIGPLTLTSSNFGDAKVNVPASAIVSMELVPEPEGSSEHLLWYRPDYARVQHAYPRSEFGDFHSTGHLTSVTNNYVQPLCEASNAGVYAVAERGPGKVSVGRCSKCSKRAE